MDSQTAIRKEMIATCQRMNSEDLNVGSAGNLSVRIDGGFLITPSGIAYDKMDPSQIVEMDNEGRYYGDFIPSSEWRFHHDIFKARPDVDVVLHSHATHCAILACCRLDIPPIHYMVGVSGGSVVKCSGYATFGTQELSVEALEALGPRNACLLGNHGVIAVGKTLNGTFGVLAEVENLARIYIGTRMLGGGALLSDPQMDVVLQRFKTYGKQTDEIDPSITERVEPPVHGGARLH
ncbi:class II aldolase/adducin family protein [Telmatospirillum sp.]|uniref:class II aldolase/adducin family protein n=1 Tax=Telmatospirillum sp. TaxID=2079197 RepID=UPI0028522453|nr:class II aldolase/adducin family protein [Telmatospirillum sp.]MDR3440014.1 class II aldolase/adducin family protein [Telmatospirillum sp.]